MSRHKDLAQLTMRAPRVEGLHPETDTPRIRVGTVGWTNPPRSKATRPTEVSLAERLADVGDVASVVARSVGHLRQKPASDEIPVAGTPNA